MAYYMNTNKYYKTYNCNPHINLKRLVAMYWSAKERFMWNIKLKITHLIK